MIFINHQLPIIGGMLTLKIDQNSTNHGKRDSSTFDHFILHLFHEQVTRKVASGELWTRKKQQEEFI